MADIHIAIRNFVTTNTYETFAPKVEENQNYVVSDSEIEVLAQKMYAQIKEHTEVNMSVNAVRAIIVGYLTSEFDSKIFGVDACVDTQKHVMKDDAWKKYRNRTGNGRRVKFPKS